MLTPYMALFMHSNILDKYKPRNISLKCIWKLCYFSSGFVETKIPRFFFFFYCILLELKIEFKLSNNGLSGFKKSNLRANICIKLSCTLSIRLKQLEIIF